MFQEHFYFIWPSRAELNVGSFSVLHLQWSYGLCTEPYRSDQTRRKSLVLGEVRLLKWISFICADSFCAKCAAGELEYMELLHQHSCYRELFYTSMTTVWSSRDCISGDFQWFPETDLLTKTLAYLKDKNIPLWKEKRDISEVVMENLNQIYGIKVNIPKSIKNNCFEFTEYILCDLKFFSLQTGSWHFWYQTSFFRSTRILRRK